MLRKNWKTVLTATLSAFLFSCAGKPPALERKIEIWDGTPERGAICRTPNEKVAAFVTATVRRKLTKRYARKAVLQALAADNPICIRADDRRFASFTALPTADLGVLLAYIETLLYRCEKWKP